jgi:hypothetical protein
MPVGSLPGLVGSSSGAFPVPRFPVEEGLAVVSGEVERMIASGTRHIDGSVNFFSEWLLLARSVLSWRRVLPDARLISQSGLASLPVAGLPPAFLAGVHMFRHRRFSLE